jgi:hypothetical protein
VKVTGEYIITLKSDDAIPDSELAARPRDTHPIYIYIYIYIYVYLWIYT